jgi:hypothetical protein
MATKKAGKEKGKQKKSSRDVKSNVGTPKKVLDDETKRIIPKGARSDSAIQRSLLSDPFSPFRAIDPDLLLDSAGLTPDELASKAPSIVTALGQVACASVAGTIRAILTRRSPTTTKLIGRINIAAALSTPQKANAVLLSKIRRAGASKKTVTEVTRRLRTIDIPKAMAAIQQPNVAIGQNPLLAGEISVARLHRLGRLAGVPRATMDKVRARGLAAATLSDRSLAAAVSAGVLSAEEGERVACATGLFRLVDENLDLTGALLQAASLTDPKLRVQSVRELVRWTSGDWEKVVVQTPAACPAGVSAADYASALALRVQSLFPTDALMLRLEQPDVGTIEGHIAAINPILSANQGILKRQSMLTAAEVDSISGENRERLSQLLDIIQTFPGLEFEALANDTARPPAERAAAIAERIASIRALYERNPDVELLRLDYSKKSSAAADLDFGDIPEPDRARVIRTFKAYQRAYKITSNVEHTRRLVKAGYSSAAAIVADGPSLFQQNAALSESEAAIYYRKAQTVSAASNVWLGAAIDAVHGGFDLLQSSNPDPQLSEYLKSIEGYAELFGRQDYCRCDHCCSVLSPGAYFVDLMHLVDTQITQANFSGAYADHALNLRVRRPDLWILPLTCENTNTLIPQLRIVCEILATFIAKRGGTHVYPNDLDKTIGAIAPKLAAAQDSFRQPASLPLRTVEVLLAELGTSRAEISRVLGKEATTVATAALGLAAEEIPLITTAHATQSFLKKIYGQQFPARYGGGLADVDAQDLLPPMGLNRAQLGELVQTRFVTADGKLAITIAGGKRNADSIQNDVEWVSGLTLQALDRMHRFTRLWRKQIGSIPELDLLLGCLHDAQLATGLDLAAIRQIAEAGMVRGRLSLGVEDACAIFGKMPSTALAGDSRSLFDRVFNPPGSDGVWLPQVDTIFIHPQIDAGAGKSMELLSAHLQASLGLDSQGLLELIENLVRDLNLALAATPGPTVRPIGYDEALNMGFPLTSANLSVLYRHARLAKVLGLSIGELFRLIELTPSITQNCIASFADVFALLEIREWLKKSGIPAGTLAYVTAQPGADPGAFGDAAAIADGVIADIAKDQALFFADTVFAKPGGLSDSDSRAIVLANPSRLLPEAVSSPLRYSLTADFAAGAPLIIPKEVQLPPGVAEPELGETLKAYHPSTLVPKYLANRLNVSADVLACYLTISGGWAPDDPALSCALHGTGPKTALTDLVASVLAVKALFEAVPFDLPALQFIGKHDSLFCIPARGPIDVPYAQRLVAYREMLAETVDPFTAQSVDDLVTGFQGTTKFTGVDQDLLASLLRIDPPTSRALQKALALSDNVFDAFRQLQTCGSIVQTACIAPEALAQTVAAGVADLTAAVVALRRALALKYRDPTKLAKHSTAVDDNLLGIYRDALVAYILHSLGLPFKNEGDLYRYFLIDPQVESCFRTSRVVAAISSVQLYIQRVLLRLEQDAAGKVFRISDAALEGFRKEWDWRQRYRVWEANRKVFLWPENWLTPDVRDDKTSLFRDFEGQLRQKEIDEPSLLELYTTYIQGLQELAHLKITGAFREQSEDGSSGVLHLFAATGDDPPVYYYRAAGVVPPPGGEGFSHLVWHPWSKVDLKIPVRRVSPIVYNKKLHVFWCEIVTTQQNQTSGGSSVFVGYTHKLALKFSVLNPNGRWNPPQRVSLLGPHPFAESDGVIEDPLIEPAELAKYLSELVKEAFSGAFSLTEWTKTNLALITPRYDDKPHGKAIDGYTLRGGEWEQVYPEVVGNIMELSAAGYQLLGEVDLFARNTVKHSGATVDLRVPINWHWGLGPYLFRQTADACLQIVYGYNRFCTRFGFAQLMADPAMFGRVAQGIPITDDNRSFYDDMMFSWDKSDPDAKRRIGHDLLSCPSGTMVQIINGSNWVYVGRDACLVAPRTGTFLLVHSGTASKLNSLSLHRLDSQIPDELARRLYTSGLNGFLALSSQQTPETGYQGMAQATTPGAVQVAFNEVPAGLSFDGPLGDYYWEAYFQMPMTIASLLNSQARYEDARKWFHYVFDPTATATGSSAADKKHRMWRFLPFRAEGESLHDMLRDPKALDAYRQNPFSPHAIARVRPTAYKKAVVMQYVGNLLDWADSLFLQFQMETINEAVMLYNLASDILGPRPPELGACSEEPKTTRTFAGLDAAVADQSEWDFLVELEHETDSATTRSAHVTRKWKPAELLTWGRIGSTPAGAPKVQTRMERTHMTATQNSTDTGGAIQSNSQNGSSRAKGTDRVIAAGSWTKQSDLSDAIDAAASFQPTLTLVPFCIPVNQSLLDLWNRVEDRLNKIRHCLDINGERRDLALFAPEIDPGLLIRARAEGIPLADILGVLADRVPPYRFTFLIEKAKQFASTLDTFGNALLSALEKKDGEELNLLRNSHEKNMLLLNTRVRKWEADAAANMIEELSAREAAVTHRRDFYQQLIDMGLSAEEWTERISRHVASASRATEATMDFLAGVFHLIPDIGSPFAMKYGGSQTGAAMAKIAGGLGALAQFSDALASSAGMEANFARREQEWRRQFQQAQDELVEIARQKKTLALRQQIAERAITLHEKSIEQNEQIAAFFEGKFTQLNFYIWVSKRLREIYRQAFNSAYALAKMAEQAYIFERGDNDDTQLSGGYWNPSSGGLLAAGALLADLGNLERRYLETNYRDLEITQAVSLAQINPAALANLRKNGSCNFRIPEYVFNLAYPGHYRRVVRSVRLTIPCVAGPLTNIGATLTLQGSWIRKSPGNPAMEPDAVPLSRTLAIATSSANNDGGAFEMNFRDERYLPFEGAGAISDWKLDLPQAFRAFDYGSITDVIVHLSYTAKSSDALRTDMEGENQALLNALKTVTFSRLFSLRHDFPTEYSRLVGAPLGTQVEIDIADRHLPYFLNGQSLSLRATCLLGIDAAANPEPEDLKVKLSVNGSIADTWTKAEQLGGLPAANVGGALGNLVRKHTLAVMAAGVLAPTAEGGKSTMAIDPAKLRDILLYCEFKII